jgi:hypothetical protein
MVDGFGGMPPQYRPQGPSIRIDEETKKWLKIMAACRQTNMRALVKKLVMDEKAREAAKG